MSKEPHMNTLKEIQEMAQKIRGQKINESIMFEDDLEKELDNQETMSTEEPNVDLNSNDCANGECNLKSAPQNKEDQGMEELDKSGELDMIRKITLNGMIKLNDTPEDPKFQALLKIFQICNKAVDINDDTEKKI